MPQKSEFQIISGNQAKVQAQLNQLAAQNWRPILMTAVNSPAGTTVFVILEGIMSSWEQR
jgi:uncharacterized membrane protein YdcZ (DUF606 family)